MWKGLVAQGSGLLLQPGIKELWCRGLLGEIDSVMLSHLAELHIHDEYTMSYRVQVYLAKHDSLPSLVGASNKASCNAV